MECDQLINENSLFVGESAFLYIRSLELIYIYILLYLYMYVYIYIHIYVYCIYIVSIVNAWLLQGAYVCTCISCDCVCTYMYTSV